MADAKKIWKESEKRALLTRLFKGRNGNHGKETGVGGGQKCAKTQCT